MTWIQLAVFAITISMVGGAIVAAIDRASGAIERVATAIRFCTELETKRRLDNAR